MSSIRSLNILKKLIGPQIPNDEFQGLGRYAVNFIVDNKDPSPILKWVNGLNSMNGNIDPNFELIKFQSINKPDHLFDWIDSKLIPGEKELSRKTNKLKTGNKDLKLISVKLELLLNHQFMRTYTDKFNNNETKLCLINANIHPKLSLAENDPILKKNMYVLGTLGLKNVIKTEMGLIFI